MKCLNPYQPFGENRPDVSFPCGQCRACKVRRTQEWSLRLWHENAYHKDSCFLTLTYDDEHLPYDFDVNDSVVPVLVKSDFQKFMKRLRKRVDSNQKIKYFACGEYGGRFKRPHYHAILFGIEKSRAAKLMLEEVWNKGFAHQGYVTPESCRYVAGYVQKKIYGPKRLEHYQGIPEEFQLTSQGFGLSFAEQNENLLRKQLVCSAYGRKQAIPRYYKKKLGLTGDDFSEAVKKSVSDSIERSLQYHKGDWEKYLQHLKNTAKQRDLELEFFERNIL